MSRARRGLGGICTGLAAVVLIGWLGVRSEAAASDVTGTWNITPFLPLEPPDKIVQSGTTLTLCVPGVGTVATGTIDPDTGVTVVTYPNAFPFYCSLGWTGTFASASWIAFSSTASRA